MISYTTSLCYSKTTEQHTWSILQHNIWSSLICLLSAVLFNIYLMQDHWLSTFYTHAHFYPNLKYQRGISEQVAKIIYSINPFLCSSEIHINKSSKIYILSLTSCCYFIEHLNFTYVLYSFAWINKYVLESSNTKIIKNIDNYLENFTEIIFYYKFLYWASVILLCCDLLCCDFTVMDMLQDYLLY